MVGIFTEQFTIVLSVEAKVRFIVTFMYSRFTSFYNPSLFFEPIPQPGTAPERQG